ncbi:MAG TPA: hypothetical protein VMB22_08600 [Verrucomicrobiae bacterium]|nr:hypothetical protein [Verrucomicrobiae bacterium]
MAETANKLDSLRLNRFDSGRIMLALTISLAVHVIGFGGYELGRMLNLPLLRLLAMAKPVQPQPAQRYEQPLEFVTVEQPSTEAPEHAKFYSSHNSVAANPDTADTQQPKLDGKQAVAPATETVLQPHFTKTQEETSKQQPDNSQPSPQVNTGNLTLGQPKPTPTPERPRTLSQALAMANRRPELMMRQNGGVQRQSFVASLDAQETPFGSYDQALIDAVTQQWYDLLDQNGYSFDRPGQVVITFRLHEDGRVTDVQVLSDTADDKFDGIWAIMCQAALEKAAPFGAWPKSYLLTQGANYRDLRFQFNYIIP